MKEQIDILIKLQALDLEQEAIRMDVLQQQEKVSSDRALLSELTATLARHRNQLSETKQLYLAKEVELEEAKTGLVAAKQKFNAVSNSREYAAAEREVENFTRLQTLLEEEILQLSGAIEENEALIVKHESEFSTLEAEIQEAQKKVDKAEASIQGRVSELEAQSKAMGKKLAPAVLGRYRFIRSRRKGEALVLAKDGTCTGCHMRIPPQVYILLQKQEKLQTCQNCQRILYFDPAQSTSVEG